MANESDPKPHTLVQSEDLGPNDVLVMIQQGPDYVPSERVAKALDDLATALAEEETAQVSGYSFGPQMTFDSGLVGGDAFKVGCVRLGCSERSCTEHDSAPICIIDNDCSKIVVRKEV